MSIDLIRRDRWLIALCAIAGALPLNAQGTRVIDSFDSVSQWTTNPAKGVEITLHPDAGLTGRAMRIDFDFHGNPGYGIVHRQLNLDLPQNYEFRFAVRGEAPTNTLEFKLVDPTGANVWWSNNPNFDFPREWRTITRAKRQICFAWGPSRGEDIRHVAAIEFAITAGSGGKGSVWIDDLSLAALDPESPFAATAPVASTPLVGTWESALSRGEVQGAKIDFAADGSFLSTLGIMGTFGYTVTKDRFSMHVEDARQSFDNTVSFRIQNDSLLLTGENMLGKDVIMKRVGASNTPAQILGLWSFVDYTGATAFVDLEENGKGYLRMPMRTCSGTWTASGGHFTVVMNGQATEREYSVADDVLTIKSPGHDAKYNRRSH